MGREKGQKQQRSRIAYEGTDLRQIVRRPSALRGAIPIQGDKSISHRALLLNSIANGKAKVTSLSSGEDVRSTRRCLEALGVLIEPGEDESSITVTGSGGQLKEPGDILDAGNSGTSMRLLSGLLASQPFFSVLTGDRSLRSRPMGRIVQPLTSMGALIHGRNDDTLAPLAISGGSLRGIEYTMPVASAQVKSSILLAALSARSPTVLHQPARSRDHTERMVNAMGGEVEEDGLSLVINPGTLSCVDVDVPGDISSAAFWMVAGLCHPDAELTLKGVGINPTRAGILIVLESMGAIISQNNVRSVGGEPVADLVVRSSDLHATEISGDIVPLVIDELPVLAVAACFAQGTTLIKDAQELRMKESDRVLTTVDELTRLGANIQELPDGMMIRGSGRLVGAGCGSQGDHRLAMALGIAGMLAEGETEVEDSEAASVSYPQFWQQIIELSDEPSDKSRP